MDCVGIYRCQVDTIHPKVILAVVSEESSKLEADSDNLGGCRARRSRLVNDLAGAAVNMPAETQHSAEAKCWLVSEKLWRWQIVNDDNLPEDVQVKGVGPRAEGAVRPDSSGGRRFVPAASSWETNNMKGGGREKQKTSVRLPTGTPASRSVQASSRTPLVQTGILEIHRKLNIKRYENTSK